MNTTLSQSLMDVNADGVRAYGQSALSGPTAGLVRRIGRRRRARAVGAGATAFGVTGALAAGVWMVQERGAGLTPGLVPSGPSVSSVQSSVAPSPSPEVSDPYEALTVGFSPGATTMGIAALMEDTMGIDTEAFLAAVQAALPPEAEGNAEGWLAPGDYTTAPPEELAEAMINKTLANLEYAGVEPADYQRTLTVASLIAREARLEEQRAMVSTVIYNRLDAGMPLELDSTIRYIAPSEGVFTTADDRAIDNPYNTYLNQGLPPGPIGSPSRLDIEAAVNPAEGDWRYFVVVNLVTGEMRFASTYEDHMANVDLLLAWWAENGDSAPVNTVSPSAG